MDISPMPPVPPAQPTPAPAPMPPVPPTPPMAPQTKVMGVERRLIGFGFALFLMLVILAVLYAYFTRVKAPVTSDVMPTAQQGMMKDKQAAPVMQESTGPVTADSAADQIINQTQTDESALDSYTQDEVSDVQDGSNI